MESITAAVKLCECGCGLPAPMRTYKAKKHGYFKGEPARFIRGHNTRKRLTPAAFWINVDTGHGSDACWPWMGARQGQGYGTVMFDRHHMLAHRVAYMLTYGDILPTLYVCHKCDNPICCNPIHLFIGTPQDNALDMVRKGRHGTKNYTR